MIWSAYKINEQVNITNMYSLFEAHYDNGFSFSGETHNFWECFYVIDGSVCVSGDGRVYNLTQNEIIFHKPMELHQFNIDNENGATIFVFSFSAEGAVMDFFKNKVFRLLESQTEIIQNMLNYIHRKTKITGIPENTHYALTYMFPFDKVQTYPQMISTYIYQLLLSLCDDNNISVVSDSPDAVVFRKAVDFMNNNICRQPSISETALFCHVSETGLKRIFYKYSGLSVHKYFVMLKIRAASELLKDGAGVTEVSERLGFGSQGYFSAAFKREMGLSPTEFKRINSDDAGLYQLP